MRAVVQGLDTRQSWDRYLRLEGEHDDIRHVRRMIQRIRDEFAAAARRCSRHGIARLMQIDAERIADSPPSLPSLEEFAIEHGLDGFSQVEQLEYYKAHLGAAPGAQSRRKRVIARQLEALRWLEDLVAVPPRPEDPPEYWLNPDLAKRLEKVGITTLAALALRVNGIGHRWWAGIPGIGAGKAERIVGWLRAQQPALGITIGAHVGTPRNMTSRSELLGLVQNASGIVPIEKFVPPTGLDGSRGEFRADRERNRLDADTDIPAMFAWIASKASPSEGAAPSVVSTPVPEQRLQSLNSTQRSYLKESERFLLWSVLVRGKPLSSLTPEDCQAFLQFIADPQPATTWCGPRGREKWSPLWRPFEGPLSPAARRHAAVVLKNMYGFFVVNGYVVANPWQQIPLPAPSASGKREFDATHWQWIMQHAGTLALTSANQRLLLALKLIRTTGIRLGEAVGARVDDIRFDGGLAYLHIPAKSGKDRSVPLSQDILSRLSDYLAARSLHPDPANPANRGAFLLGAASDLGERAPWSPAKFREADPKRGINAGTLCAQLKVFFAACVSARKDMPKDDQRLFLSATSGWLRSARAASPPIPPAE
jgi:integrase